MGMKRKLGAQKNGNEEETWNPEEWELDLRRINWDKNSAWILKSH